MGKRKSDHTDCNRIRRNVREKEKQNSGALYSSALVETDTIDGMSYWRSFQALDLKSTTVFDSGLRFAEDAGVL